MSTRHRDKNHIHQFLRIIGKRIKIWRCKDPFCTFTIYTSQQEMLLGRVSTCWNCNATFPMRPDNLEEEFPTCSECQLEEFKRKLAFEGENNISPTEP